MYYRGILSYKYRTSGKNLLQMKNRFQRFQRQVLQFFGATKTFQLVIWGFFTLQKLSFCMAIGVHLLCKCSPNVQQKRSFLYQKDLFFVTEICAIASQSLYLAVYKQHNKNRAKLKNSEPKISLCVQITVLSGHKCKYCIGCSEFTCVQIFL